MNLAEESIRISGNLKKLIDKLESEKSDITDEMDKNLQDLRDASSKGDRSENAAFTAAVEKVSDLNAQLANVNKQLQQIKSLKKEDKYKNIGMVVYYTTVLLEVNGKQFIFKLYPGEVSAIEDGILSSECRVGKAIWKKKVGDIVSVRHKVTGENLKYKIVDMY